MKLIQKVNYYFLHDEDETARISDYFWFYGTLGFLLTFLTIYAYKLITF